MKGGWGIALGRVLEIKDPNAKLDPNPNPNPTLDPNPSRG